MPLLSSNRKLAASVNASIYFLKKDPLHEEEKPYAFRYELNTEDVPQSNMEMEKIEDIPITDIRGIENEFTLDVCGFAVLKLECESQYEDFHDPLGVEGYFRELENLLKKNLGASKVEVFRHGV